MKTKTIFIFALILLTTSLISAYPGIPHQFYGTVQVNGLAAPNNNVLVASIDGDTYATVTADGKFGFAPNIFYIEDPDGDRTGDTITFYLGGKNVGTIPFANNGFTQFNIETDTTCGDNYCLGEETCSSCQVDCGVCTDPPVITINSPQEITYDTLKIDLDATADQTILVWMYSLNDAGLVTFTPNIVLTAQDGVNSLTVVGINQAFQSGSSTVSFTVSVPICGDLNCEAGFEDCSNCPTDCGTCPIPDTPSPSGSGGGGGGGGGGGLFVPLSTNSSNNDNSGSGNEKTPEDEVLDETSEDKSVGATLTGITGAVVGFMKSGAGIGVSIAIVLILAGVGVMIFRDKPEKKGKKK